jgi:EAL and modified HD-GYP domain-containing signal transduction protein
MSDMGVRIDVIGCGDEVAACTEQGGREVTCATMLRIGSILPNLSAMDTMLARQPIFDHGENILGYQIFHHDRDAEASDHAALDALLESGVDRLTNGSIAFLNVTNEMLLTGAVELLDRRGVLFVIDGGERDPEVVARCRHYHELGYHLAVDLDPASEPNEDLLEIAEVARVDVREGAGDGLRLLAVELRTRRLQLLAEGVSNARVREECAALGFRMFQGYLFNQPEVISQKEFAVEHLRAFRLLKDLRNPEVEDAQILDAFHRDPGMTYRFLRMVNSAAIGGQDVTSISFAVRLMGREALSRWLSLLLLAPFGESGLSAQIAASAVVRARHCELVAELTDRPWASDTLFTLGLFSRLDLLLGTSMEFIVEQVSFTEEMRHALLYRTGADGEVLALVEAYEMGQWEEVKTRAAALQIGVDDLARVYLEALPWGNDSNEVSRNATEGTGVEAVKDQSAQSSHSPAQVGLPRRVLSWLRSLVTWRSRDRVTG